MQVFSDRTRAAVAVLLLVLVPPAPSRKAPKHDTGGIKVREVTSGEYPTYGPSLPTYLPPPSYGGPPKYGSFELGKSSSFEHHSLPSFHPPGPSPSHGYPVSYGHPPPFEIEVYEEPVIHHYRQQRGKGKGKGGGKGSKEEIKDAIAQWKIEKWFEKGMKKISKSFGYGKSEEYELVEYGAPPPPLYHPPPPHYPPPPPSYHPPPPSYHPPPPPYHPPHSPPVYHGPTPKLVEVRVPKCKAKIEVPTYVTETLVKTSKVHITKVITTTKEVQVKEFIVNTKYSTKTKTVTEHVPQYVEPKTVSLPAETIYKTQPPQTIYKTKTQRETVTKTSYHEIKAPVPTYGAPKGTSKGSSGSSEGTMYRMYQHTPPPKEKGKGDEVSFEKIIPFYAKRDSEEDSSYAHF